MLLSSPLHTSTYAKALASHNVVEQVQIQASYFDSETRYGVENFIKVGFQKCYQADIEVTTPYLLSLKKGNLKSALGVRSAQNNLFIEQYLDAPIEDILARHGQIQTRSQISEIAHLYSNSRAFTLPLMLVTAISLKLKGFAVMAFTGTEHVIRLIRKTGINVSELAPANAAMLSASIDNWGSYYDSKPVVAYIDLNNVISVINGDAKLSLMFCELSAQIAHVVSQLGNL